MHYIFNHYKNKDNSQRLCMFISGGAGVGKSYLTRLIIDWLNCCCSIVCGKSPVMVCASTGTAARNITRNLPVQHGNEPKFHELSGKSLKKLRSIYMFIHVSLMKFQWLVHKLLNTFIED